MSYITKLYKMYDLPENPTPEQVEAKAMELLANADTKFYGAEMVLNRRIDSSETNVVRLFAFASPEQAQGLLLLQKAIEQETTA